MNNTSFQGDEGVTSFSFSGVTEPSNVDGLGDAKKQDETTSNDKVSYVLELQEEPQRKSSTASLATKPYVNMTKDDVIRFSDTTFWNTLRLACICVFWIIWLAFLATVVALTITTPRCQLPTPEWWQKGFFYQIYVRSFYDADGDGIGDLQGVAEKLPVLKEIGVTALMLSSVFKSRNETSESAHYYNGRLDYGYEVIDYEEVDESVGGPDGFNRLVKVANDSGIKLVLDFVPNHSGIDHPWFKKYNDSNSTTKEEGWNYYVHSSMPNSWKTQYGENAWSADGQGKLYLHNFLKTQPDVNLRSSFIGRKFEDYLKHWLDKGVSGFKVVATDKLFEDSDLANETGNKRENFDRITRWREIVEEKRDHNGNRRIVVTDSSDPAYFYGSRDPQCTGSHLSINYRLTNVSGGAEEIHRDLNKWFGALPPRAPSFWTTGDQDRDRLSQSAGKNHTRAAMLLKFALPGSTIVYYGEELDMSNDVNVKNLQQDPVYHIDNTLSRFGARNLMGWTDDVNCGFSNHTGGTSVPWLEPSCEQGINIQDQRNSTDSMWHFVKKLGQLKANQPALQYGRIRLGKSHKDVLSLVREYEGSDRLLFVINFGQSETDGLMDLSGSYDNFPVPSKATVTLTTSRSGPYGEGHQVDLKKVAKLPPGFGFVATWKYKRTIKG